MNQPSRDVHSLMASEVWVFPEQRSRQPPFFPPAPLPLSLAKRHQATCPSKSGISKQPAEQFQVGAGCSCDGDRGQTGSQGYNILISSPPHLQYLERFLRGKKIIGQEHQSLLVTLKISPEVSVLLCRV